MAEPPQIALFAERHAPFDETIDDERGDYTGAAFAMQVRSEPGDTGTPLISLGIYSSGQGLSVTYETIADPSDATLTISVSRVRIRIAKATLEALDTAADTAQQLKLAYDLHVTPSGGTEFVMCAGAFIVDPGVTL